MLRLAIAATFLVLQSTASISNAGRGVLGRVPVATAGSSVLGRIPVATAGSSVLGRIPVATAGSSVLGGVATARPSLSATSLKCAETVNPSNALHSGYHRTIIRRLKGTIEACIRKAGRGLATMTILLSMLLLVPSRTNGVSGSSVGGSAYTSVDSRRGAERSRSSGGSSSSRSGSRSARRPQGSKVSSGRGGGYTQITFGQSLQMSPRPAYVEIADVSASPRTSFLVLAMFMIAFAASRRRDGDSYNDNYDNDNDDGSVITPRRDNKHNTVASFILDHIKHRLGISTASFYQFEFVFLLNSSERALLLNDLNKATKRYEFETKSNRNSNSHVSSLIRCTESVCLNILRYKNNLVGGRFVKCDNVIRKTDDVRDLFVKRSMIEQVKYNDDVSPTAPVSGDDEAGGSSSYVVINLMISVSGPPIRGSCGKKTVYSLVDCRNRDITQRNMLFQRIKKLPLTIQAVDDAISEVPVYLRRIERLRSMQEGSRCGFETTTIWTPSSPQEVICKMDLDHKYPSIELL